MPSKLSAMVGTQPAGNIRDTMVGEIEQFDSMAEMFGLIKRTDFIQRFGKLPEGGYQLAPKERERP